MTSKTAYDKFKLRFNKLDTNFSIELTELKFCELFNKAQYHFIDQLLKIESSTKENQKDLQQLLVDVNLTGVHSSNKYEVDLPDDWYWVVRANAIASNECGNVLNCILVDETIVNKLYQNSNWKPSLEWEETFFTIGANKVRIYTDDFRLKSCNLVYYREPIKIDIKTGEKNIYGEMSKDVNPEWNDSIVEEIIDLAVLIATTDTMDNGLFQAKSQLRPITT